VARRTSPARLAIALAVAAVLAVFLLYTSLAGGGIASLAPSELARHAGQKVSLTGKVARPVRRDRSGALRFRLTDLDGKGAAAVSYRGDVSDQFKVGRHVSLEGRLVNGVFVGIPGTLVTKCPSKYAPKKT
jgi:cytochrome c-type biogenesis protein CcmE